MAERNAVYGRFCAKCRQTIRTDAKGMRGHSCSWFITRLMAEEADKNLHAVEA